MKVTAPWEKPEEFVAMTIQEWVDSDLVDPGLGLWDGNVEGWNVTIQVYKDRPRFAKDGRKYYPALFSGVEMRSYWADHIVYFHKGG